MRICQLIILGTVGFLAGDVFAGGEFDRVEAVRQAKITDAAFRSVQESIGQLAKRQSNRDQLAAILVEDPATYRKRENSEALLLDRERKKLRAAVRGQMEVFAASRADLSADWVERVMRDEQRRIDGTVDELLAKDFGRRYAEARELAVRVQSTVIGEVIRPQASEIERLAGTSTELVERSAEELKRIPRERGTDLVERYTARVVTGHTLFEENEAEVERRTVAAIAEGLEELWRQLRFVGRHDGGGAVERSVVETTIANEVARFEGRYGVFPSVLIFAGKRAQTLEEQLFRHYLGERIDLKAGCPELSETEVLAGLPRSPDRIPRKLADHGRQRARQLRPGLERRLIDAWVTRVADPELRGDFRRRLGTAIASGRTVFASALKDCVKAFLSPYRQELAERELAEVWPKLADLTQELGDDTLKALHAGDPWEQVSEQALPARPLHLEESRRIFEERRRSVTKEGRAVIQTQMGLVQEENRKKRFQRDILGERDRSEQRRAFWQKEYEDEVLAVWTSSRERLSSAGMMQRPDKYGRILDLARETISEVITPVFQEPGRNPLDDPHKNGAGPKKEGEGSGTGKRPGGGDGSGDAGGGCWGGDEMCGGLLAQVEKVQAQVTQLDSERVALLAQIEESQTQVTQLESERARSWLLFLLALVLAGLGGWHWNRRSQHAR